MSKHTDLAKQAIAALLESGVVTDALKIYLGVDEPTADKDERIKRLADIAELNSTRITAMQQGATPPPPGLPPVKTIQEIEQAIRQVWEGLTEQGLQIQFAHNAIVRMRTELDTQQMQYEKLLAEVRLSKVANDLKP